MSTVVLALFLLVGLPAQEPPSGVAGPGLPPDVEVLLAPIRDEHGLPALGGAIVTLEGLHAAGAVGVRSSDEDVAVTSGDLWHLGSCTKAMTATLAARMVEQGLLAWETPVGEVYSDLAGTMDPLWRDVSMRLLLTNRGGAPADLDADGLWLRLWSHQGSPTEQRRTLVEALLQRPPARTPGTRYLYSNGGFALAGAMLETLAGKPWEQLLRREVFEPLGMEQAGFGAPGRAGELDQPRGHHADERGPRPQAPGPGDDNPAAIAPAGTVHASLADWARFARAHLRGARGEGEYLQPETWRLLHTPPQGQDYAFGWVLVERAWAGGPALTHSGSNTMWYCTIWIAPQRGFGVLAVTNLGGDVAAEACDQTCAALIGAWLERAEGGR